MKTETKHTAGPWAVYETGMFPETNHAYGIRATASPVGTIAKVEGGLGTNAEANAHLIAAAPQMYEALEACERAAYCTCDPICNNCLSAGGLIRAALTAARGGRE